MYKKEKSTTIYKLNILNTEDFILSKNFQIFATGRRKKAIAQVQLINGTGQTIINGKPAVMYLQEDSCALFAVGAPAQLLRKQNDLESAIEFSQSPESIARQKSAYTLNYDTLVKVEGGGLKGQADAIKLGIARALCILEESYRPFLRKEGFLTRDSRSKERKKYGLKKARKAPQFSKR
uniref:Small ribosomal subunit protein uS9c n=1 Tax=Fusochloris perforata TaxID=106203 RepID=A0A097KPW9_9CHLO|nr:ribosomal protein S9 [Fusochloris perforata]AIT95217.1 ribosomal protein S9 [Fusochloris perforata]